MNGTEMIAAERQRQIESEGWTPAHDDEHSKEELSIAAMFYVVPDYCYKYATKYIPWPWHRDWLKRGKHSRIRQLVIAGALIAAEIDRLQRAAPQEDAL